MTEGQKLKEKVDRGETVICPACKSGTIEASDGSKIYYKCNNCDFIYRISRWNITI